MECVSCGLWLDAGLGRCPGCGTEQQLSTAGALEAACAAHPGVAVSFTCSRCGAFGCVQCNVDALGVCAACVARGREANQAARRQAHRLLVGSLCVCAVGTPLSVWGRVDEEVVIAFGGCSLLELLSVFWLVRRPGDLSVLGVVIAALAAIPLLGMVTSTPWPLVPLTATAVAVRSILKADGFDRELWHSRSRI